MPNRNQIVDRDSLAAEYIEKLPFPPYPVQEEALLAWFTSEQGVLVCAPTGTGKTLIAEAAVYEALRTGRRMYYTTPLIALTDQKLEELQSAAVRWGFSAREIGLVTGNRRVNGDAPVLVVVAEILLNRLLAQDKFDFSEVDSVVMDEFHSFNDLERGIVWELTLGMLPPQVRTLLLSATVGNALEFTSWLERAHRRKVSLVQSTVRKVPLEFRWIEDMLLEELMEDMYDASNDAARRTPALIFCFNREHCWSTAELLKGKRLVTSQRQQELSALLDQVDMSEGAGPKLRQILLRGIGVHHAGVLPKYRRLVEHLFQRKLLSCCVCTETLSAGINLPARSVVLPSLMKGPRDKRKLVETSTAQQIFGRAGRPQFDDQGFVFALAHEDDVKILRWREKYDQIPEDTPDPKLRAAKKQLKKKMPKRRTGETYWSAQQFEQLRTALAGKLSSRGPLPWRLLAFLLRENPLVEPIRQLVGRRLLPPADLEKAKKDLNRMLISLWVAGYLRLDPLPKPIASNLGPNPSGSKPKAERPSGLFGVLLEELREEDRDGDDEDYEEADEEKENFEGGSAGAVTPDVQYELVDYRPELAEPTERLPQLLHLRSINPLYGVYLAGHLAIADQAERLQVLESVLELPANVARDVPVPLPSQLPPGPLATDRLDPRLLSLGLATAAEITGQAGEDDPSENRGFGRFEGKRLPPLPIAYKVARLFQHDYPRVEDIQVRPCWVAGELLEFGGQFNKFVTARKLQKQEGLLFRHLLRLVLLLDEMANVPPAESTPESWEDPLDELAAKIAESCRTVDPQSTDEMLSQTPVEETPTTGRRRP